jgi:hypothetical protein
MGKNLLSIRCFALFVLLFASGNCDARGQSAQQKREAVYQATLQSYSDVLKPGMTRKGVEDYLQSKGIKFEKMCCIDERSAYADLVRIGKEKHPWYCSEHNVYIAFQFVEEPHEGLRSSAKDSDKLKSITVHHSLDGCL